MKRWMILLTCGALAVLTACSGQGGGFAQEDLSLTVEGQTFDCDTNITQVIDALGEDYDYAEGMSCAYDGLDKTFSYSEAEFYTNPLEEGDTVTEIYTQDPSVATSKGLAVGATREEVIAAYGQPDEDDGYTLIYRLSDEVGEPSLCFDLEGD